MKCGRIIHSLFKNKINIFIKLRSVDVDFLRDKKGTKVTIMDDDGIVYHLRCSPEETLSSCARLKIYAFDAHGEDFETLGERIHWEEELSIKFRKKYLPLLRTLIKEKRSKVIPKHKVEKKFEGVRDVIPVHKKEQENTESSMLDFADFILGDKR